jgi:hypothetical protein
MMLGPPTPMYLTTSLRAMGDPNAVTEANRITHR